MKLKAKEMSEMTGIQKLSKIWKYIFLIEQCRKQCTKAQETWKSRKWKD